MAVASLNRFLALRSVVISVRNRWISLLGGVQIGRETTLSTASRMLSNRRGDIVIGSETLIAFKVMIYTWDTVLNEHRPVQIGDRCFIGGASTITPGVRIGDECIVGAGAVVFDDVPARSIVGGNPARILRSNIEVGKFGRLKSADAPKTSEGEAAKAH